MVMTRRPIGNVCDDNLFAQLMQISGELPSDKSVSTEDDMFHFDTVSVQKWTGGLTPRSWK